MGMNSDYRVREEIVPGLAVLLAGIVLYYIEDTPEGETIRSEVNEKLGRRPNTS